MASKSSRGSAIQKQRFVDKDTAVRQPRRLFLTALSNQVPRVAQRLHSDILPLYQAIPAYIRKKNSKGPWFRDELGDRGRYPDLVRWQNLNIYDRHPAIKTLRQALLRWGQDFNLTDEWLLDVALYTLYRWDRNPLGALVRDPKAWNCLSQVPVDADYPISLTEAFTFKNDGWNPSLEPWSAFEGRVTNQFGKDLAVPLNLVGPVLTLRQLGSPQQQHWLDELGFHLRTLPIF